MTYEVFKVSAMTRADLREIVNSQHPQWLRDTAQYVIDLGDKLAQITSRPMPLELIPLLPPQLPPGNGQPSLPCFFCDAVEHKRWCITLTPTRGYTLASFQVRDAPPDWPGLPPDHPRMRPVSEVLIGVLEEANLTMTVSFYEPDLPDVGSSE